MKAENEKLNKKLKNQEKVYRKQIENKVHEILSPIFTAGQIKKLLHPNKKKVKWSKEDIASAIALRSVSPKGYRFLRNKKYPLPGLSTLRKWAAKVKIEEGVLDSIIDLMKVKSETLKDHERLCALSFDEIYCSQNIEIDRKLEKRVGPHKTVQVGMVRGVFSKWKQPIYFDYDKPLTKEVLDESISKLFDAGFTVVSVTTDLGPTNSSLWSSLNIGIKDNQNCFFAHPKDPSLKVFVFADAPHLLKLIRNHLLDHGFEIGEIYIGKHYLEKLVTLNKPEINILHKVTKYHLDVKSSERQKVLPAAQVMSNKTASAIEYCGDQGFLHVVDEKNSCSYDNYKDCADLIRTVNDWFDVLNSKRKFDSNDLKCAYGVQLESQNEALTKMSELMRNLKVRDSRYKTAPFQKGVILTNNSLQQLYTYLLENYNSESFQISYLLTNRLCQDVLENFFSYIRGMGSGHDKPSALQFKYRLRWYVLGKHSGDMISDNNNTECDEDNTLIDSVDFRDQGICIDLATSEALYDEEMEDFQYHGSCSADLDMSEPLNDQEIENLADLADDFPSTSNSDISNTESGI